ncbi:hypothetical protein ACHAXT_012075 [Thalassiosira profunda]
MQTRRARDEEEAAELDADGEGPPKKPRPRYCWICDVCKERAFDTREEAVEHEEQCDGGAAELEGGPGVGGAVAKGEREGQGEGEGAGEDAGRESGGPDAPPARLVSGDAASSTGGVSSAGAGDPQPEAAAVRDDGEAAEEGDGKKGAGGDEKFWRDPLRAIFAKLSKGESLERKKQCDGGAAERDDAEGGGGLDDATEGGGDGGAGEAGVASASALLPVEDAEKAESSSVDGAVDRAEWYNATAVEASFATTREELLAPIKSKIKALEADKKGIQESAEEYEEYSNRGTAKYGAGVVAAEAKLREAWAAEMTAVVDKLADERASFEKVEGLLAEGVKRLVREVPRHVREQSARIVSLQSANDEATQQVAKTGVALEEALTELRKEKKQRADEREELEAAKASAEGRAAVLERELGEERGAAGRASNLEARLEEAAGTNAKLVEEVASLTTAREEATALLEAANARFASLGEEAATTQRRLSVEAKELREAKAEAEKHAATMESGRELEQRQFASVERQCEEAKENVRRLTHENNVLRLERDNREAQAAAEKGDLERQLAELRAKLDAGKSNSTLDAMSVGAASENDRPLQNKDASMENENSSRKEEEEQRKEASEECTSNGELEQRVDPALRPGNDDSVEQSVGADIAEQPVRANVADQDAEREDGGDAEESIPNNGVDSVANLALLTQGAFLSLCGTGMLVQHLPAMQGRDNNSNNGCAAIAALVASQSLASGALSDTDIIRIINRSAGPVLDAVRTKRNEGPGTFIHLVDVLDYLYDNGHLQQSQLLDTVGGSALDDLHLETLKACLSRDDVGRVAAVFFFRSHLVALRVVRDEESNVVWVELIDSLARGAWVAPGDRKTEDAVRVRCKIEHLTTLLNHYCLSRYTDDDKTWIDRAGPWDEREPGTDRRSFEAYIFCDRNGEEDIQEFVVENDDAMDVDAVDSGIADVASSEETLNEEQGEAEMAIDEEVSEETSNEMAVDEPSPARKEKELSWTIWQLLQPSMILGPNPAVCDTEICDLAACSIWSLGGNRGVRTSLCLDCQEKDRGGWPGNPSDLPFSAISKMQIEAMAKRCSIHANPDMPYVHQEGDFICSDPKCQNLLICDAPGDYCSECGCPYCPDHLDKEGVCPACIEAFEAIDDESMEDGDASGAVNLAQLKNLAERYCGVSLHVKTRGTIGPSAFRAELYSSGFGTTYGTAVEAFFVAAAARYCVDRHPGCAADDLRMLLNDREGQVDIVDAYLRERRERCLLADRNNDIRVALQRVSGMVSEDDFAEKLRSHGNLDEERLKEVRRYFKMLARLTPGRINAIRQGALSARDMRPYELPWATLDRQQLADVVYDATTVSHSRTIYSNDVDMLQLHSFFREFFIGTSAKGGPGWHAALSTEPSKIGSRSDQDDEANRVKEMRLKFLILLLFRAFSSELAPDDISELFAPYVPEEWRDLPGMHPAITAGNVYEVVAQARNSVVSFLENATIGGESLVANPELLSALSVLHGILGGDTSAIELANVILQEKIGANQPRLERGYAARLEHEENIDAKRDAFFDRLKPLREVFAWLDTYRTRSEGGDGKLLTDFLADLRGRLAKLDISPDDIERIMAYAPNSKQWANAVDKARNNALGRLGCLIVKALGEFCFGGCGRRLLDMLSNASHIDHEDRPAKTADPSTIANNDGLVALMDEIFKTLSTPKCLDCHDMGEHRSFLLRLYKKLLLIEPDSPRTHDNRLTPTEALLTNAISYVRFTLFLAESYAGDWRNHGSDFAHVRGTTLCVFGIAVDGLVNFEARHWNGENTGINHNMETDYILERLIGQACGYCFNLQCQATNGDLTQKSPFALYGDRWDHNRKKSEGISEMIGRSAGPVYICSEICSWTDKLCGPCNAKRDASQLNGCKERCFEDVGTCECVKVRGKARFPKKV